MQHYQQILLSVFFQLLCLFAPAQKKILAFYTAKEDPAHISFVHEANRWLSERTAEMRVSYDSTNDWSLLNLPHIRKYNLVIFLDTRPEKAEQRKAFEAYMREGGAWMGFHFSAFALTPSAYNQDWDWYHNEFLGSGQYASNTWRPTAAVLKNEGAGHPATKGLPQKFTAAPCEWYRWEKDLRQNTNIRILLSVDSSSFPLGTGPKPKEIWHSGYYPIAWTNTSYRMLYMNMGHNDMDYGGTGRPLSSTFGSEEQNRFILQSIRWLLQR